MYIFKGPQTMSVNNRNDISYIYNINNYTRLNKVPVRRVSARSKQIVTRASTRKRDWKNKNKSN